MMKNLCLTYHCDDVKGSIRSEVPDDGKLACLSHLLRIEARFVSRLVERSLVNAPTKVPGTGAVAKNVQLKQLSVF